MPTTQTSTLMLKECSMDYEYTKETHSVYLYNFLNTGSNGNGDFTIFLKQSVEILKGRYRKMSDEDLIIYADCNTEGLAVSLKSGGRIKEILTRIEWL